jgi:hypothetical protein
LILQADQIRIGLAEIGLFPTRNPLENPKNFQNFLQNAIGMSSDLFTSIVIHGIAARLPEEKRARLHSPLERTDLIAGTTYALRISIENIADFPHNVKTPLKAW